MNLQLINREFSICKVQKMDTDLLEKESVFIGKSDNELSVICETNLIPENIIQVEHGWSCFRIAEDAAFEKYGMIAFLSKIIANEKTGILVVATYDTDYIFVKENKLPDVKKALELNGCTWL
ncbi:MAG TPA: ACT domain-containing protein [Lachnospiraceae bacterium]|nr:ACT domain-containing protein [Lachnospiraceae bacterium]